MGALPKWLQKWIITPTALAEKYEVPPDTIDFDSVHVVFANAPDQHLLGTGLQAAKLFQTLKRKSKVKNKKNGQDTFEHDAQTGVRHKCCV